jgi:hypothetical protein
MTQTQREELSKVLAAFAAAQTEEETAKATADLMEAVERLKLSDNDQRVHALNLAVGRYRDTFKLDVTDEQVLATAESFRAFIAGERPTGATE